MKTEKKLRNQHSVRPISNMANSFSAVLASTVASVCLDSREIAILVASIRLREKINLVATVFNSHAANGLVFMRSAVGPTSVR